MIVPSHCVPLAAPGAMRGAWKRFFTRNGPIYVKPRLNRDWLSWIWEFWQSCTGQHLRNAMPVVRRLSLESLKLFEELAGHDGLSFGFEKNGYLRLYKTASGLRGGSEELELVKSVGVEGYLLDGKQLQQSAPGVRIDALGGVLYPENAQLVPWRFVQGLASCLTARGVKIVPFAEVYDFELRGMTISRVRTTRGDFASGEIVLTAGSWVPDIARTLGIRIPILGAKGYSFTFKRPAAWPSVPFSLGEAGVAVTAMGDLLRIAGSFALVGLDFSWNPMRMKSMLAEAHAYLPDLEPGNLELLEVW